MNVFEDLIGELKDENLLEDTVIDVKRDIGKAQSETETSEKTVESAKPVSALGDNNVVSQQIPTEEAKIPVLDSPEITKPADDREFFRKRAMEEVSSLQMVEHVLSGVEREHLKTPAAAFDELEVKKALHKFLSASGDVSSEAHAEAEYALLQETQGWHTALSARDTNVSVSNIRRFCENSRPVLSSQALMALARFYRNSSFTEDVRSKFDFVMTRLFSRDAGLEKRKLLFSEPEMVGHIQTLYNNWSSLTYYSSPDHSSEIELAVQRFGDIIRHFESAQTFDDLLNADVFNSIRHFKEECGELFYVPKVTAAAIDCNVRLGNKYVDLIFKERDAGNAAAVESKYGYTYDQAVSGAAGKTLLLVDLLKERPEDMILPEPEKQEFEQESFALPTSSVSEKDLGSQKRGAFFGVSRWLVITTVFAAAASAGLYFWADRFAGENDKVTVASEMDIDGSDLKTHIKTIRLSHETAYAVTQPSWDALNEADQKEFLKRVFAFVQAKGVKKVNVLNYKGRTVAFASKDRFEIIGPN